MTIYGREGFLTYCTLCDKRVGPSPFPRATLQAALTDRLIHIRETPHPEVPEL